MASEDLRTPLDGVRICKIWLWHSSSRASEERPYDLTDHVTGVLFFVCETCDTIVRGSRQPNVTIITHAEVQKLLRAA